jgi:hypothetical protein
MMEKVQKNSVNSVQHTPSSESFQVYFYRNLFRGKDPNSGLRSVLHHGNDPAHDALRVYKFLAKKSITKTDHLLSSPDLGSCDFWLFPKLKNALNGQ